MFLFVITVECYTQDIASCMVRFHFALNYDDKEFINNFSDVLLKLD